MKTKHRGPGQLSKNPLPQKNAFFSRPLAYVSGEAFQRVAKVGWVRRDAAGFAELVGEHQAMVFSIAFRYLRDRAVAEELAQDVFLKLHHELPKMESAEHVKYWLRKVITHRAMDYARSASRRREIALDDVQEPAIAAGGSDPFLQASLRKLVASLPDEARMIIVLRYQEEMEPQEIAETLAMPIATVKSRLRRSLVLLRGKALRLMGEAIERHR